MHKMDTRKECFVIGTNIIDFLWQKRLINGLFYERVDLSDVGKFQALQAQYL